MNQALKQNWNEFKKELTWNNTKIMICGLLPLSLYMYGWTFWLHKLTELLTNPIYSSPKETPDQAVMALCIACGIIAPLWLAMYLPQLGFWLGKVTRFYKEDNKTRIILFDDIGYSIKNMPQDQREKIKEILSPYKSKLQLKKERLESKSWLRRNFT